MNRKKSVIRAGAVLLVALAAGHLVQTMNEGKMAAAPTQPKAIEKVSAGAEPASAPVDVPPLPATASLGGGVAAPSVTPKASPSGTEAEAPVLAALPDSVAVKPEPALPALPAKAPEVEDAAPTDTAAAEGVPANVPSTAPVASKDCPVDLTLAAAPQAMIAVRLTASCRVGERVVLRHAGLTIAEAIPASGTLEIDLPALKAEGEVSALFSDAKVARGAVTLPDLSSVQRFAVQWMADDAFQLHILENGADYGQPGHVWAEAPVSVSGGYLLALGNPLLDLPMMVQVYTWPANPATKADVIVESAVTEATCGRELLGETVSLQNGSVTVRDLSLAMPDCDAIGDILVLKNPGQDVTLAATN